MTATQDTTPIAPQPTPPEPPRPPAASSVRVGPVVTRETLDRYAAAYSIGFAVIRQARPLAPMPWDQEVA